MALLMMTISKISKTKSAKPFKEKATLRRFSLLKSFSVRIFFIEGITALDDRDCGSLSAASGAPNRQNNCNQAKQQSLRVGNRFITCVAFVFV